jgi:hypothetical protein
MATRNVQQPLPAMHLQQTFENAVRDINQPALKRKVSRYRTPIVQRPLSAPSASSGDTEKRALSDAAKALAQLWKVGPGSSR